MPHKKRGGKPELTEFGSTGDNLGTGLTTVDKGKTWGVEESGV
jgi:hypothetical protein